MRYDIVQLCSLYGFPCDLQWPLQCRVCKIFIVCNLYKIIKGRVGDVLAGGCVRIVSNITRKNICKNVELNVYKFFCVILK